MLPLFQKIRGIASKIFSFGVDGPQIAWDETADAGADRAKVLTGASTAETDLTYAKLAGADPVNAQDFVTKNYGDANYGASNTVRTIEIPIDNTDVGSTVSSSAIPPATAKIVSVKVRVNTAFSNVNNTVTVGNATDGATAFAEATDSKLSKVGTYEIPQYTEITAAEILDAAVGGSAAAAGSADILVTYTVPSI